MAENKKSFIGYVDWSDTFDLLDDAEAGKLIKHFFKYIQDQNPVLDDKLLQIAFNPIKLQLKRDLVKWDEIKVKRSDAGKKSAEVKKLYKDADQIQTNSTSVDFVKQKPAKSTVNGNVNVTVTDTVNVNNRANALSVATATGEAENRELKNYYANVTRELEGKDLKVVVETIKIFIRDKQPKFIEPYQDYWNIFANAYHLAQVEIINDNRKNKFKTRSREPAFDFIKILDKIKNSRQLKGTADNGTWKVTFDWVFENQSNYVKILEGNYDGA